MSLPIAQLRHAIGARGGEPRPDEPVLGARGDRHRLEVRRHRVRVAQGLQQVTASGEQVRQDVGWSVVAHGVDHRERVAVGPQGAGRLDRPDDVRHCARVEPGGDEEVREPGGRPAEPLHPLGHVAEHAPLRRTVTVEDVGNAAAFLCSDLAAGITGEITYVDAGYNILGMTGVGDEH